MSDKIDVLKDIIFALREDLFSDNPIGYFTSVSLATQLVSIAYMLSPQGPTPTFIAVTLWALYVANLLTTSIIVMNLRLYHPYPMRLIWKDLFADLSVLIYLLGFVVLLFLVWIVGVPKIWFIVGLNIAFLAVVVSVGMLIYESIKYR